MAINFEAGIPIMEKHWNDFIELVKKDLDSVYNELRTNNLEIKRLERINKIINYEKSDINYLLLHKESILAFDNALKQKIDILKAFQEIDNLSNAVAIRTYNEISNSPKIKNLLALLEELTNRQKELQNLRDKLTDIIYGANYDISFINQLCDKYKLDLELHRDIILHLLVTTLPLEEPIRKEDKIKVEKVQKVNKEEQKTMVSYKEDFDKYKKQYEDRKEQLKELLAKYYSILNKMSKRELQSYQLFIYLDSKEDEVNENYEDVISKTRAMHLFKLKKTIEENIQEIATTDYSDKEKIDLLKEDIEKFNVLADKLKDIDSQIVKIEKEKEVLEDAKIFFLTNSNAEPIIPFNLKEPGFSKNLMTIFRKSQEGFIQQKKGNVMPLKISDKKFKEECGKTVFAVRNSKAIASYIKLNLDAEMENNSAVFFLTASYLKPNTILEDTNKVIKENRAQIIRQIRAIEKKDPQQLGIQAVVRNEIMKKNEPGYGDGNNARTR